MAPTRHRDTYKLYHQTDRKIYISVGGVRQGQGLHHMTGVLVQNTELETCYSSTDTTSLPSPVWPHSSTDRWFLRQTDRNRCFDIRHNQGGQRQQQQQQQQQKHNTNRIEEEPCDQLRDLGSEDDEDDGCVLNNNDPESSNDNTDGVEDKSREDMNKVIAELTSAIVKSKAVSAVTNARSARADKAVKQMASPSKTEVGPKSNSRALKCSKQPERARKKARSFHNNKAYLNDERIRMTRGELNLDHFNSAFVTSSEARRHERNTQPGVWHLTTKQREAGLCAELDYKHYNYNYQLFLHNELQRNYLSQEWWNNYGDYVTTRRKRQKWCKTLCKSFCFVILLISFVVVVICVSVFIIKDKYKPS